MPMWRRWLRIYFPSLVWALSDPGLAEVDMGLYTGYACKALRYSIEVAVMVPRVVAESLKGLGYVFVA